VVYLTLHSSLAKGNTSTEVIRSIGPFADMTEAGAWSREFKATVKELDPVAHYALNVNYINSDGLTVTHPVEAALDYCKKHPSPD
jgi:hypothetical protein